ncbi:MAG TPA: TonB-dependent receptor [Bryobacteraceae bacterium]|nr:TonB-dependent receptor [Bryobacteraceae bacterium]
MNNSFSRIGLRVLCCCLLSVPAFATIFSTVRGIVHDPSHRPVPDAQVTVQAKNSDYTRTLQTKEDGRFEFASIPAGEYTVRVTHSGFSEEKEPLVVVSGTAPVLHFRLAIAGQRQSIEVAESPEAVNPQSMTPTTMVDRKEIEQTPGASLSNSLKMITNFVPGAYVTHDQLHVRGGHQLTWAIDGVPIPNTNIASNVGPQIDPKDIDVLEVQRGGYSAEYGDRTYGVFNVVPRTGFERNGDMELNTTYGTFQQTNNQISFGDHTERLAYFGSINGNRSNYGLETPGPLVSHDRVWGLGGFGSLIYNAGPSDQLRLVTSLRRDDYQIPNDQAATEAGVRDVERERDVLSTFTWVHTFSPGLLFTASPFMHFNRANYDGDPTDAPISTTQHLDSTYAGAQAVLNAVSRKHNARIGVYGFGQHDNEFVHVLANDGSGSQVIAEKYTSGYLAAGFLEDQYKLTGWLTLTGGIRLTHFTGAVSENAASPRVGAAVRIPHLNWILRGFYGRYYQAPPLSTVAGPLLSYAVDQGLGIIPLKGERDEENQVGLTIPVRGWTFDVNSFRQRARNYFDHNAIGNSNVFFPLSIAGARIYGQEITIRSPRLFQRGEVSISYAYQHAEAEGPITGGLTDFSPPDNGYFFLDHDQRHTLNGNFSVNLPRRTWAAANVYYGSGFTDGDNPGAHLEPHTTVDLSLGKEIGENLSLSVNGLNIANRRFLLDNSETFGGTHYAEPRQIYVQLRYRLHL